MPERRLNVDIGQSIAELLSVMKEFVLKQRLYRILLRGKGLEFDSYREYAVDDDASSIDWKASKRANKLLVKQYRDETNLKIVFVVDVGKNMVSGSALKLKCEYAAEVVASLAYLVVTNGDKVGFVLFNDSIKEFVKPSGGMKSFEYLVDRLINPAIYNKASNVEKAFEFVRDYVNPPIDSVVIVSDFVSFNERAKKNLAFIAEKFETLVLMIRDPLDRTLPDYSGEVIIENPQTGEQLLINPKVVKKAYEKRAREQEEFVRRTCLENQIDILELMTTEPFVPFLSKFLKGRVEGGVRAV